MTAAVSVVPASSPVESLAMMMRAPKLPSFARYAGAIAPKAEREGWTFGQYLHHLAELDAVDRYLKDSDLLPDARNALSSSPAPKVAKALPTLCEGGWSSGVTTYSRSDCRAEARQTSSAPSATSSSSAVTGCSGCERDLRLEKEPAVLDAYDALILDDIGYVQSRDEIEVLILAERCERRSVIIASNVVFSEWDRIFEDPMTTAAVIDRLVHHVVAASCSAASARTLAARARTSR